MPLIEATIGEGRSPEQIRALISALHDAAVRTIGADPAAVRVIIREIPLTHWASGDVTVAERRAAAAADNP